MSEDREFAPTRRRLERAADEGDLARSGEAQAIAAFAAAAAALSLALLPMLAGARALVVSSLAARRVDAAAALALSTGAFAIPGVAAAAALACGLLQSRAKVRAAALVPRWERLNPLEGLRRIASRETLLHTARWSAMTCSVALFGFMALRNAIAADLGGDPAGAIGAARRICAALLVPALTLGAVGAALEYATAQRARLRRLRMSRDEVKRELRESEGDPLHRAGRARLRRALAQGGAKGIRDASVLVVNPTHVAVALRYDSQTAPIPMVVSKGADARAAALRALAERYGVPIVEEVALARLLFTEVAVGAAIPESTFGAVAAIIAAIARQAGRERGAS